ncbi:golgin candidate 5-like isoform X1 [Salvia hispanica]|uniref:golgin candidate 5-like isoform X1 n=1 Tax=Salvia hispanica TaxID=49212 RepID=UPI0020091BD0|nr:golgin candidate 5-like isoform X1 [Salvia hispanica]XP_047960179.1 golgin candidate 5-like isoform X1 [Salvia hispanica]XP_047960180.1 golgin candidate 5-like isoform X1 [Salvia hispanica]
MAWFSGKVSLGNLDFAGAVNKLSESVKNIEKNFDSALGLEEKSDADAAAAAAAASSDSEASGLWPLATDRKALFEPIIGLMGQRGDEDTVESSDMSEALDPTSSIKEKQVEDDNSVNQVSEVITGGEEVKEELRNAEVETGPEEEIKDTSGEAKENTASDHSEDEVVSPPILVEASEQKSEDEHTESTSKLQEEERLEVLPTSSETLQPGSTDNLQEEKGSEDISSTLSESLQPESVSPGDTVGASASLSTNDATSLSKSIDDENAKSQDVEDVFPAQTLDGSPQGPDESRETHVTDVPVSTIEAEDSSNDNLPGLQHSEVEASKAASDLVTPLNDVISDSVELKQVMEKDTDVKERMSSASNSSNIADSVAEHDKVMKEMKMMEAALHGAARQAQAKADEIARLMNENEQLKTVIDELKRKTNEAEIESLREEYHQRVAVLERKVYALTRERDTLRREQNKKSDAAALLKEKDEIINQVMAEGEQLSKKQAAQEGHIRKLRAQIRELEEEKKGFLTKIQVEENTIESLKRDKAETENLLQETVEKHQAELAAQKDYYTNALAAAKEAVTLAEARANTEARTELESRLREAEERESMLVQTLEGLRQTLTRTEQQAVFREDMLRKDIEDLQKRYQASERRCEELITQVPDSTRPLLRQIEAMQETAARRAEAWAAVERSLNSRLQEAEANAAAAEEKERSISERLTQTLSRINVLEAQISCLRAEQTQLTRSLEKERHKAAEHRQEYLALKEEADTNESRANQLEEELKELRRKHKEELHDALMHQELLQQELDREKTARLDQERAARVQSSTVPDQVPIARQKSAAFDSAGNLTRKISSASSLSSMEESFFLQTTLGSSETFSENRSVGDGAVSPYYMKSVTSNTFEAALRQKEGELASYSSRLASLESIRDSLAEELVKLTAECEKLRTEAATLPGIRAELEALRRRHSAALELMGERDEELEELRADIVDLKEMYREQVNMLVNKIHILSSSMAAP